MVDVERKRATASVSVDQAGLASLATVSTTHLYIADAVHP